MPCSEQTDLPRCRVELYRYDPPDTTAMSTLARNVAASLLAGGVLFVVACASDVGETAREHVTRAHAYRAAKQYPEAVIELRRAIQLEPRNGEGEAPTRRHLHPDGRLGQRLTRVGTRGGSATWRH